MIRSEVSFILSFRLLSIILKKRNAFVDFKMTKCEKYDEYRTLSTLKWKPLQNRHISNLKTPRIRMKHFRRNETHRMDYLIFIISNIFKGFFFKYGIIFSNFENIETYSEYFRCLHDIKPCLKYYSNLIWIYRPS